MNRLGDRLPVERLPERSRARLERAVFEALDADAAQVETRLDVTPGRARAPRWWLGAAAGLAAAAVVAVVFFTRAPATPAGSPVAVVRAGSAVAERLLLDGASIELDAGALAVATGRDADGYLVVLERGRARFDVRPRAGRPPFVVQAGEVRVEVVGTRFAVDRQGDRAVIVVDQGTVRVLAPEGITLVNAGERWPAGHAAAEADGAAADPSDDRGDGDADLNIDEPEVVDRTGTPGGRPTKRGAAAKAPTPGGRATPPADATDALGDLPDAQTRYEQAAALESRDPDRAARAYRALAEGRGPWAAYALFAAAQLELGRGRPDAGRALLKEYARRFPRGANREDVRVLLKRPTPAAPR